ncbi:MAG: sigma 54-interacting transcriptional regulator [Kofleriaceae bacterium]
MPGVILVFSRLVITPRLVARGDLELVVGHEPRVTAGAVDPPAELDDDRVSAQHAAIKRSGSVWQIRDLGSRNGTFVDGVRIDREVRRTGDVVVRCGDTVLLLLEHERGHGSPPADDAATIIGPELATALAEVTQHAHAPSLLIHGESGTGKELAARRFHDSGPRANGPLIAVNCATIPEGIAERVLFGARKGAYSGATTDTIGCLQEADGGTLFLDEVAELELTVQAKLLRALETRIIAPLGAAKGVSVDVGVVAASHQDLRAAVAARTFREDLYFRLAHPAVRMPPLRERPADVPRLVERFLAATRADLRPHSRLVETCCTRAWPGNVRELRNSLGQAATIALAAGRSVVRIEDLPDEAGREVAALAIAAPPAIEKASPNDVTREAVIAALDTATGNISAAARTLGLHRTQLRRLIDRHGIPVRTDEN